MISHRLVQADGFCYRTSMPGHLRAIERYLLRRPFALLMFLGGKLKKFVVSQVSM